jgi:hypothetical protein
MPTKNVVSKNVVSWGAQAVRSAIFTSDFDGRSANELYLAGYGEQPSSFQSAPPNVPYATSQASGFNKIGAPALAKSPGRVDLSVTPSQMPNQQLGTMAELPDVGSSLDLIQRASVRLCADIQKLSRVGLILELVRSANTIAQAQEYLEEVLPFPFPVREVYDLVFQYTKRAPSRSLGDTALNVVYRWSFAAVQQFVTPAFGAVMPSFHASQPSNFFIASLHLDINTVPGSTQFEAARGEPIFREMREKIDEVRRGGPDG